MDLKLCTFNCCSLRKNVNLVRELCNKSFDIIFLQETLVTEDRLGDLAFINELYDYIGTGAHYSDKALASNAGRCEGGLACLWKRDGNFNINKIVTDDKFIVLQLQMGNKTILLVNVYIKSDLWEARTQNAYLECLSQLEHIIASFNFDSIYFLGDFNADPFNGRAWTNLCGFMSKNSLECFDFKLLDSSTFTFVSFGNSYTRWLDHIVGRDTIDTTLSKACVLYDMVGSDHLPLSLTLHVSNIKENKDCLFSEKNDKEVKYVNWDNLTDKEIEIIEHRALSFLVDTIPYEATHCLKLGCRDDRHLHQIDHLLDKISWSIHMAAEDFSIVRRRKNKFKVIPGWNRNVKALHDIARTDFLKWMRCGRLRDTEEFREMNESRRKFKQVLNDCKINELKERSISIEESYRKKSMKEFWKNVKTTSNKIKRSTMIDGKTDKQSIIDIFTTKFLINNSHHDKEEENNLLQKIRLNWHRKYKMHLKISCRSLKLLIQRLNPGMGHDGIHTNFLKRVSDSFLKVIVHFLNACYSHCYIPGELLKGDVNPVIKDVKGNTYESNNYRPVMQSSCILKILEMHILDIFEEKIHINVRQFGFKRGTSTTDACLLLKEAVKRYLKGKGKVFSCFIDLSKAFDKVDHFILGNILLERDLPIDMVLLVMHYLRNQKAKIVWDGDFGEYHVIDEGVRQGGILSPFLFKLYIDSMIHEISNLEIGCKMGFTRLNILAYADDIVIIGDSKEVLEILYDKLSQHLKRLRLIMNVNKSKCMIFDSSRFGTDKSEIRLINDNVECVNTYKYLGHMIERNLDDVKDIEYRLNLFYAKFNVVFRKFKSVSLETILFLFNSYCLPDYGLSLWNVSEAGKKHIFKVFRIAYHNAFKKMAGASILHSSHDVLTSCNQFLFEHYLSFLISRYFKRILSSRNSLMMLCRPYLKNGYLFSSLLNILKYRYEIAFAENDLDVIKSRISWVQLHENTTGVRFPDET